MSDKPYLLTDDEVITFIIRGYHIVNLQLLKKSTHGSPERGLNWKTAASALSIWTN